MWRGGARSCNQRSLRLLLRRSRSSLAFSSSHSLRCPAARCPERAWMSESQYFFNGDNLQAMASVPYQDSVSTIDSVLCTLSMLTSCIKQGSSLTVSPYKIYEDPARFHLVSAIGYLSIAEGGSVNQRKAFGSVAMVEEAELLEADNSELSSANMELLGGREFFANGSDLGTEMAQAVASERKEEGREAELLQRQLRRRQKKMETEACLNASLEYQDMVKCMCKKQLAPNVPVVRGLMLSWFEPFRDAIMAEQEAIKNKEPFYGRSAYGPYLMQLPPEMLAVVAMHKLMAVLMRDYEQGYVRLITVASVIGEAVELESDLYRVLNKGGRRKKQQQQAGEKHEDNPPASSNTNLQKSIEKMIKRKNLRCLGKTLQQEKFSQPWGNAIHVKVGTRLMDILMDVAYIQPPARQTPRSDIPEVRPAFNYEHRVLQKKTSRSLRLGQNVGVITCDPLLYSSLENSARYIEMPYMPMLVKPVDWTSFKKGGYMILKSHLMRTHGSRCQQITIAEHPKSLLKPIFDALNMLGSTSWRINKQVHDVAEKIWAEGGRLADLVDRENVELPEKPDTKDVSELVKWRREFRKAKRINSDRHSQRCDIELKLSVARKYREEPKFYYPHNLDFRGRAYPMHHCLNHLGSDLCRGMLEFGEGRPLGSTGLRWLKIQLANAFAGGVDKLSFESRVAFADENITYVIDSADLPLDGERWWLKAEDPFQCLACCICLRDALKLDHSESYICHLPIQQDGSCNGLQHYAALGRDSVGAASVNLTMGEKPADVYSRIAQRVKQKVEADALKDPLTDPKAEYARMLLDHVDRKLVKQTVMTSVYGVTYVGARAQMLNKLEERGPDNERLQIFRISEYAAKVILDVLGEMFKDAKGIMNWLGDCAKLIASENEDVRWLSPLGLPIVQPYRRAGWRLVRTSLQTLRMRKDDDQPVFVQRQRTAFPPNFVHSLDSTHMMMTATACGKAGLCFAGVHDSYWTHACDVDKMHVILREKFVELYSQPILENLLSSFQKKFPHIEFPPLPTRGEFNLEEVLGATYFFN